MKIKEFWFLEMGFNCMEQGFKDGWETILEALRERMIHESVINTEEFFNQEVEDELAL